MNPSDLRPSPRREIPLQGPRPSPLKLNKDSRQIKKPSIAPQFRPNIPAATTAPPLPQPLILYAVSPKIIYTNPNNFMTLVQRLTGPDSTTETSVADLSVPSPANAGGELSPAARIATFEKSSPSPRGMNYHHHHHVDQGIEFSPVDGFDVLDRTTSMPGILSPPPTSLSPISPDFFPPNFEQNIASFINELNPAFAITTDINASFSIPSNQIHRNNISNHIVNHFEGYWDVSNLLSSTNSPINNYNNLLLTPLTPSPRTWGELFNQVHHL